MWVVYTDTFDNLKSYRHAKNYFLVFKNSANRMRGTRSHFLLLFLKNLKLLVRAPVTLVCEILIPTIIVVLFYG